MAHQHVLSGLEGACRGVCLADRQIGYGFDDQGSPVWLHHHSGEFAGRGPSS